MRMSSGVVVVAMLIDVAACGLSSRRATTGGLRRFYLTKATVPGDRALGACGRGFHMASRFELLDVGVLDYDSDAGFTTDDAGAGPPSDTGPYDPPGSVGWVRTGGASKFREAGVKTGSASTNCASWSSGSADASGTVAYLADRFTSEGNVPAAVWNGGAQPCNNAFHVWCVEDHGGTDAGEESGRRRRHRIEE
jgi:hypothetical protein